MVEEKLKTEAIAKFTAYLTGKKLRKTPERFAILDKIYSLNEHFDIDTLYMMMEQDSFRVSRATVYNTIDLLCECGLVRKHQFGNMQSQYEKVGTTKNHQHLICSVCGKIKEVKDSEFLAYMNTKRYPAFSVAYFNLYVYGICNNCVRKLKRKEKK